MRYTISFFMFCFISCSSDSAQPIKNIISYDGLHIMLRTGIPEIESTNQINFVAKRYGVRFQNVGCAYGKNKIEAVKKTNDSISKIVAVDHGHDWLRNLYLQVDTLNKVSQIAYEAISNSKLKITQRFYYLAMRGIQKDQYLVQLYGENYEDSNPETSSKFYVGVDYKNKFVFEVTKASILQ